MKLFDFDERPLGNYEDTPMHWVRLDGDGLPGYNRGTIDDEYGHDAPPSFRLNLEYGNTAYEYRGHDLFVLPACDYLITAYIQPDQIQHARAFLAAHMVDRLGHRVPGTTRVSELVCSQKTQSGQTDATRDAWQRVEIRLPGDVPQAYAIRLQAWILQSHAWRKPPPDAIDPIVRRDVRVGAWIDDIKVYSLPRVRLRLSNPAGVVTPAQQESFVYDVHNATSEPVQACLTILDEDGRTHYTDTTIVSPFSSTPAETPVPELPAGLYEAQLRLIASPPQAVNTNGQPSNDGSGEPENSGRQILSERHIRFAVVLGLESSDAPEIGLGLDLGPWRGGDVAGLRKSLQTLHCGAVKIGLPMIGDILGGDDSHYLEQVGQLVSELTGNRIEATGVMLARADASDPGDWRTTRALITEGQKWREQSRATLTYLAGVLPDWQLGNEQVELRDGLTWSVDEVAQVRAHLSRFVTHPQLIVPRDVFDVRMPSEVLAQRRPTPPSPKLTDGSVRLVSTAGSVPETNQPAWNAQSILVPATIPTAALPQQLAFLAERSDIACWLQLEPDRDPRLSRMTRLADLARRLVIAKALDPDRTYVPAPLELSTSGGEPAWQPSEGYVVLRTLFHFLSGNRALGVLKPAPGVLGFIFVGSGPDCVILWSQQDEPEGVPIELYLGSEPTIVDLWGNRRPLEVVDGRAQVRVTALPQIIPHRTRATGAASGRLPPEPESCRSASDNDPAHAQLPQSLFRAAGRQDHHYAAAGLDRRSGHSRLYAGDRRDSATGPRFVIPTAADRTQATARRTPGPARPG